MVEKVISNFMKLRQAQKLKGKKPALIIDGSIFHVQFIRIFNQKKNHVPSIGFENIIIKSKSAKKLSQNKNEIKFFFGKIIARSSSDFISILANHLISEQKSSETYLIQYPIHQKDSVRKLIILVEIPLKSLTIEILNKIEKDLKDLFKKFRNTMSKIIERNT